MTLYDHGISNGLIFTTSELAKPSILSLLTTYIDEMPCLLTTLFGRLTLSQG